MHIRRISALIGLACGSGLFAARGPDHNAVSKFLAHVPLSFEQNVGQVADKFAAWVGHGNGYALALGATGATITPSASNPSGAVRIQFLNARPNADSKPLLPLPGRTSYLIGSDPRRWIQNLATYGRVEYQNVYDGINVAWYGNQGQIEYDFVVHGGADTNRIRMRIVGARKLALTLDGDVDIDTAAGAMKLRLPQIYQDIDGVRRRVRGGYVLKSANVIGFELAGYDKTRTLVIDPTLVYGSYLGSGFTPAAVTADTLGNLYVAGSAVAGLATVRAYQRSDLTSNGSCFVMKLDPTATSVLYSTYIGGSTGWSQMKGIAVDSSGGLVGTGSTAAKDFPLLNAASSTFDLSHGQSAFALKLGAQGNALVYSTYLSSVVGFAVALDGSRNAYVAGDTYASAAPTSGAWQSVYGGGFNDAFVAKLNPAGGLMYFTFLGGSGYDQGIAIAVDSLGAAYVAGFTDSASFPNSPPGARTANAGGYDTFIAKVSPDGSSIPWLTFLGGTGNETTAALVLDQSSGMLYVAGSTTSADLPTTAGVIQPSANGPEQGFIASVLPNGMSFGFVTYLGGRKDDVISTMTEAASGQLVVAGTSSSYDLASVKPIQPAFVGNGVSLFESANSGASWTAADAGLPLQVVALTGDPSSANTMLALSLIPFGVFRTTDAGSSWVQKSLGPDRWFFISLPELARSPANPAVVYAYLPYAGGPPPNDFVFRSTDGGVTWTSLANPPVSSTDFLQGLALSATDANTVVEVFSSGGVYRSTDGGATFASLSSLSTWPCTAAWQGPVTGSPDGSFYIGTYAGICKSTDNGSTWSLLAGSAVAGTPPKAIAVSEGTPSALYALNVSGKVYASVDGGATWKAGTSPGGAVSMLAVAPSNSQVVYAAGNGGVFVSMNGAATWLPAASLPFPVTAVAVNPSNPAAVYAGGQSATDGFVAKLNNTGTSLLWSTFYTGSNGAYPTGTASVASGDVWIAGLTSSLDLPITSNAYSSLGSATSGAAFLARISDTTLSCSYSLNPPSAISYGSGNLGFSVTAPSGCAWTAIPSDGSWIAVQSGGAGTASGTISAAVTANGTGSTRSGTIDVNGQLFSIIQAASSCTYSLSSSGSVPQWGGAVQITVTAPAGCPWSVVPPSPPVSVVSGGSGTGNGTVTLALSANHSLQWLNPVVQVGPQSITLSQANICTYSLTPLTIGPAAALGSMSVTANNAGCAWGPQSDATWLSVSGSGTGSGIFHYSVQANTATTARTAHITLDHRQFRVRQGAGAATARPATLNLGTVAVGQTSAARTVWLTNHENVPVNFSSILTSTEFKVASNTCGASIAAGATCTVQVTFSPAATGAATGTLTFTDDAANSPQAVSLTGTGR